MSNVVELLSTLMDQVTPSKNHTSDEWSNIVSLIKNNLNESKELISNSSEPLEESLSSVLTTLRSNILESEPEPFENQALYTPKSEEKTEISYNEVVSSPKDDYSDVEDYYPKKRRYSLTAVFRAFFGRSRTEDLTYDDDEGVVPYEYKDEGTERVPPLDFNLLSPNEQFGSPKKDADADATPASVLDADDTVADAPPDVPDHGNSELEDGASGTDEPAEERKTDETGPQPSTAAEAAPDDFARDFIHRMKEQKDFMYTPLREINTDASKLNLYLVATEMIKSKLLIYKRKLNVFNYNAVDPSIYFNQAYVQPEADYSIQIVAPIDGRQHHINFGDIIRLKRVDAHVKLDRGKRYVNILVPDKCNPTIRAWRLHKLLESDVSAELAALAASSSADASTRADQGEAAGDSDDSANISTNADQAEGEAGADASANIGADATAEPDANTSPNDHEGAATSAQDNADEQTNTTGANSQPKVDQILFDAWKRDSITVLGSDNITYTMKDHSILAYLKEYSKRLDPVKVFRRPDLLRTLSQASFENLDFIVKVHSVFRDHTFTVADSTAKALVVELDPMLVANVFKSYNPIRKGDWVKLRSFFRVEGCSSLTLRPSTFACITRLPPMLQATIGDEPRASESGAGGASVPRVNGLPSSKRQSGRNRTVNLELWASVSRLNNNFPKRLKRSPSFIEKILSGHSTVTFQKASPDQPVPAEREEGEISQ